jgi:hypothetical protein
LLSFQDVGQQLWVTDGLVTGFAEVQLLAVPQYIRSTQSVLTITVYAVCLVTATLVTRH